VQHFIHHLAPHGMAGFVLANGSLSSNQSGEGGIRSVFAETKLCPDAWPSLGSLRYSRAEFESLVASNYRRLGKTL
jgi:type I restriction enzyme M protein